MSGSSVIDTMWSERLAPGQALEVGQHLARMLARLDRVVDAKDRALLVDEKADPAGVLGIRRGAGAVRHAEIALGVAEELEREAELGGEGGVLGHGIEARAEDHGVLLIERLDSVPESLPFGRSAGSVGLGIEPEKDLLAAQIAQPHRLVVMIAD